MVSFFSGNKSAGRKKKDKTRSKNRHAKTKSQTRRKNQKKDGEREKKSSTSSNSHASTPTITSPSRTPRKERNSGKERRRVMETSRDREKDFKEEKEQDSENDDDLSKKRSYSAVHKDAPKKVDIRHRDVDEDVMKKFLAKERANKQQPLKELDEKEKILMDRIIKKKYPMKYIRKEKTIETPEDPEFFSKPTVGKKVSTSIIVPDDSYEHVPKLGQVKAMVEEKVFVEGRRDPFWTTVMEPDDEDMKDTEAPISVGTDHIQEYQDKKLTLKTPKDTKIILDEWAPLATLQKRDDDLFHVHLVFSNTVRSMINVQAELGDDEKALLKRRNGTSGEEATQAEEESCRAMFSEEKPTFYSYDRANPILSAREALAAAEARREPEPTPSQTGSDQSDSGSDTNLAGTAGEEEDE